MIAVSKSLTELSALAGEGAAKQPQRVAREFESIMISELLRFGAKPMFEDGLLDGGSAGQMAREQFFSQLASVAAGGGGVGLASKLEAEMNQRAAAETTPGKENEA